jgi:hypothetical protein
VPNVAEYDHATMSPMPRSSGFKFSLTPTDNCGGLKFWKKDKGKVGAEKIGQFFVQILNQLMNLGSYSCTSFSHSPSLPMFYTFLTPVGM